MFFAGFTILIPGIPTSCKSRFRHMLQNYLLLDYGATNEPVTSQFRATYAFYRKFGGYCNDTKYCLAWAISIHNNA